MKINKNKRLLIFLIIVLLVEALLFAGLMLTG